MDKCCIYESHLGGFYLESRDYKPTRCHQCGDSDSYVYELDGNYLVDDLSSFVTYSRNKGYHLDYALGFVQEHFPDIFQSVLENIIEDWQSELDILHKHKNNDERKKT